MIYYIITIFVLKTEVASMSVRLSADKLAEKK